MTSQSGKREALPLELLDPAGEGIYLLSDDRITDLMGAAALFFQDTRRWRDLDTEHVYMRPKDDGSDEWHEVCPGKHPRYWRLLLPRRWRPILYSYVTPKPEAL